MDNIKKKKIFQNLFVNNKNKIIDIIQSEKQNSDKKETFFNQNTFINSISNTEPSIQVNLSNNSKRKKGDTLIFEDLYVQYSRLYHRRYLEVEKRLRSQAKLKWNNINISQTILDIANDKQNVYIKYNNIVNQSNSRNIDKRQRFETKIKLEKTNENK